MVADTTAFEATELDQRKPPSNEQTKSEYDPCVNAKIASPFYLYNQDSPRPSFEVASKPLPQVTLQDLEAGTINLSPTVTQEKRDAQKAAPSAGLKFWQKQQRQSQCMTKPKQRGCGWLKQLPPRQRLLVKILLALVIIGAMVGIAVGITAAVHGGVYKNNNSTTSIG